MVNKKSVLNMLYTGVCNIYEYENILNEKTNVLEQSIVLKYENIPCRASYYNNSANILSSKEGTYNNTVSQNIKLFLDKNIDIKPGSIIEVIQNNITTKYKNSGKPAIYSSHQEIMLEIYDNIG